ncbi:MAG TPA: enoyl-CoA hydratase/isomerase family protein [Steroidobacteraceae bacterium]|nr:enoyl-CoA hydratase/isomerase family protein [Steroidobacteraceae bacterium]
MTYTTLTVEHRGAVATVWLNRPEVHNAFDETVIAEFSTVLRALDTDTGVRAVVLAGRGSSFCAGADLKWMRRMAAFDRAENLRDAAKLAQMLRLLHGLSKPTIARVHGPALAGGTGLVAACDIALATPTATFGTTEVRLGLVPATIAPYVIRAIGARAAQRYFLTGERFGAEQAQRLGLVHALCAPEWLDKHLDEVLRAVLAGAPAAQGATKRLVTEVVQRPLDTELAARTSEYIAEARGSAEAHEGIDAFFARRRPSWADPGS